MENIIFKRESNKFDDIIKDKNIKPFLLTVLTWHQHCFIQLKPLKGVEKIISYIGLKFGDSLLKQPLVKDYTPIDGVDYRSMVPEHLKNQRRK